MAQRLRDVKRGRPYPKDWERKKRVMALIWKHGLSITRLAEKIDAHQGTVSDVIWGVRHSQVMETRIAEFFGMSREELFPRRQTVSKREAA